MKLKNVIISEEIDLTGKGLAKCSNRPQLPLLVPSGITSSTNSKTVCIKPTMVHM